MTTPPTKEVAQAEADANRARQRLLATVATLKGKVTPGALARGAGEKVKAAGESAARSAVGAVKRHPLPTIGIVAAITAFLTRKPLARLFRRNRT